MTVADPRIRMVDCCDRLATPILWNEDPEKTMYCMTCPTHGTVQTLRGKTRTARRGDPRWDRLARKQGLI